MGTNFFVNFDNSFATLPDDFSVKVKPTLMPKISLIKLNKPLSELLCIKPALLKTKQGVAFLGGQKILENQKPLAQVYAGHQFGNFVPQLGDGRAILLGEVIDKNGSRRDIQLKGSGKTPFSRMGDGRAGVGPVIREYIVSEAMARLGVPSTRALAALLTGETIIREFPIPGAQLIRVAQSHIRVGTFEYFARQNQKDNLEILTKYVINRHFPDIKEKPKRYTALLEAIIKKQAKLIASWMGIGFIHGVMNTDNMALSGETIDFGPCAFMDKFNFNKVFSSIDAYGRYSYANQPNAGVWNLARFAETLLPLIDDKQETAIKIAEECLEQFMPTFQEEWLKIMCSKLGIQLRSKKDKALIDELLKLMHTGQADFTLCFRNLTKLLESGQEKAWYSLFPENLKSELINWVGKWKEHINISKVDNIKILNTLNSVNPWIIPRNHMIEACITAALNGNFSIFNDMVKATENPFLEDKKNIRFSKPPKETEIVYKTFCGT